MAEGDAARWANRHREQKERAEAAEKRLAEAERLIRAVVYGHQRGDDWFKDACEWLKGEGMAERLLQESIGNCFRCDGTGRILLQMDKPCPKCIEAREWLKGSP